MYFPRVGRIVEAGTAWSSSLSFHPPTHCWLHSDPKSFITQVYISGRPFVLRDASEPRRTLKLSDRAENLEAIEQRLKTDILVEANKCVSHFRRTSASYQCLVHQVRRARAYA